ncbi:LysR family transcriptional regulator [Dissulfurirhabdus thermomarina]|uniref:LysR family transcriptional regulator n=2 Tax=Dissulfurirhabdus thermomarina TaxID=1765737 RepID=A0A6N9TQH2_DISTH|nr:LysR family transcriptional regulator [Dissulfurirhabdus thermomarina]NMX23089.1 LysR family transcriptional regulator [Dissulfurirhabdus thermomarina]
MIEMRQVQVFLAVWRLRSFSRAAEAVHLTQPTVSGHIAALEDHLGARLFDRSGREVTPTKAGALFYPYARQIWRLQGQAEREMALFAGQEKGTLEIGGSNIPGQYILPGLIGAFRRTRPKVGISLTVGDTRSITAAVAEGDLELGVVGARLNRSELHYESFLEDRLVLVVPPDHPLADAPRVTPDDLARFPVVTRERGSGTRIAAERALEQAGDVIRRLEVVAELGSTEAVRQAVKAGLGCAVVSRRAVEDDVRNGLLAIREIDGVDLRRRFFLVRHRKRTLSPVAEAFYDFLLRRREG